MVDKIPPTDWSRQDRDLLIRLDSKVDQLSVDIKDVKDGINLRVVNLEQKSVTYDKILNEYSPEPLVKQLEENTLWIRDFKTRWKLIMTIVLLFGGFLNFVAIQIINSLHIFK